jgi:16S rRNA (guanine527-N7)-methyltransferase
MDHQQWTEKLLNQASKLDIVLTANQVEQMYRYSQILSQYNQHTNLVANADMDCLLSDHILDSLTLLPIIDKLLGTKQSQQPSLIDIGSGAGFPGLVLAIAKTNLKTTLVEATTKKAVFLQNVVQSLDLNKRVKIFNARAEELAHNKSLRAHFDYATGRAVGALSIVCELTLPFLKSGGHALLQRGNKEIELEKAQAPKIAAQFAANFTEAFSPDRDLLCKDVYVLVFKQNQPAPDKFPRLWKEIKSRSII